MEVEITNAAYTAEYNGDTYYFCCAGCQQSFEQDPLSYLETEAVHH